MSDGRRARALALALGYALSDSRAEWTSAAQFLHGIFLASLGIFPRQGTSVESRTGAHGAAVWALDPSRRAHAAVAFVRGDPEDLCGFYHFLYERELDRLTLLKMQSARRAASNDDR